ncbi:MAG: DUF4760 domain-containing protein [Cyanothece sp. SIO2G6]|nr:DUF4760 domain-containing protein [Cyanothece sp. SIO2G6]
MNTREIILGVLQFLALVAVFIQVYVAFNAVKADHERKRKQSTIEYIGKIWSESRYELESRYGTDPLTKEDIKDIENNKELTASVIRLLGQLEHIAVGVNSGVYDKDILYRMSSASISKIYARLYLFVEERRKNNPRAYIELEELVSEFRERNRDRPGTSGNIRHS